MKILFVLIGINVFLQLCILGYIYNLEQELKNLLEEDGEENGIEKE